MADAPLNISIIVPALNEALNLPKLAERINAALSGQSYELMIIDDKSRDNTTDVCAALARDYPLRLIVRENPTNGLSGAVLHGIAQSTGRRIVVMDADLQHPPERVPDLLAALGRRADFAPRFAIRARRKHRRGMGTLFASSIPGSRPCWRGRLRGG